MTERFEWFLAEHGIEDFALYCDLATYYGICAAVGLVQGAYIGRHLFC